MQAVSLEDFARRYRPLITVQIDWPKLLQSHASIQAHRWQFSRLLSLNMPWYAYNGELSTNFFATINDTRYQAVKLKDALSYQLLADRATARQALLPARLRPIPVATDTRSAQTVILDSNTTLSALLQHGTSPRRRLAVLELTGSDCLEWLPDFVPLNRNAISSENPH